jgi:hypothetical protein
VEAKQMNTEIKRVFSKAGSVFSSVQAGYINAKFRQRNVTAAWKTFRVGKMMLIGYYMSEL